MALWLTVPLIQRAGGQAEAPGAAGAEAEAGEEGRASPVPSGAEDGWEAWNQARAHSPGRTAKSPC
jgi:hypothetical protein